MQDLRRVHELLLSAERAARTTERVRAVTAARDHLVEGLGRMNLKESASAPHVFELCAACVVVLNRAAHANVDGPQNDGAISEALRLIEPLARAA